ncbi:MAG: hypothetical protein Kow0069_27270 [Promethearchaeota archaeon]
MTGEKKRKLIEELNQFQVDLLKAGGGTTRLQFWDENSGGTALGWIDYDFEKKRLDDWQMEHLDFVDLAWNAGLLQPENEGQVLGAIRDAVEDNPRRAVAVALDTNLVYSRFLQNTVLPHYQHVSEEFPCLVLLARATIDEMHYKTSLKYGSLRRGNAKPADNLAAVLEQESGEIFRRLLLNSNVVDERGKDKINQLPSRQGRLGHVGLHEFRVLSERVRAVTSTPAHVYYMKEMRASAHVDFPDAVYDSLIRYEVSFFARNTNAQVLFFTSDREQAETAETEGLESVHVRQPVRSDALAQHGVAVKVSHLEALIRQLLWYSPFVLVRAKGDLSGEPPRSLALAMSWHRKSPEQYVRGLLRAFATDERKPWTLQ